MKKIDTFLAIARCQEDENSNTILVYGNNYISKKLRASFKNFNINYEMITESSILKETERYKFLLVLSESDLDNIMMCSLGKKMLEIDNIIAVCNEDNNRRIFSEYGAISFDSNYICSNEFLLMLEEKIKND